MTYKIIKHFTESFYYDLELTARLFKFMSIQLFEYLKAEITIDEFAALDTIMCHEGICQRDLAKLILKDRANTGRVLNSLEEKGYITRPVDTKNNRLVRKMVVTEKGKIIMEHITNKIKEHLLQVSCIPDEEIEQIQTALKKIRDRLSEVVKTQI